MTFSREDIKNEKTFFKNLLKDDGIDNDWIPQPRKVLTSEAQSMLLFPLTEEEIWKIVSNANPNKSPGPDSFKFQLNFLQVCLAHY